MVSLHKKDNNQKTRKFGAGFWVYRQLSVAVDQLLLLLEFQLLFLDNEELSNNT